MACVACPVCITRHHVQPGRDEYGGKAGWWLEKEEVGLSHYGDLAIAGHSVQEKELVDFEHTT